MLMKYITYDNDKRVHIQSPWFAGSALCGKDAMSWHNSKREPTCGDCVEKQKERPFKGELRPYIPEEDFRHQFSH